MKTGFTLLPILLLMVAGSVWAQYNAGYRRARSFPLTVAANGIQGTLILLRDERMTDQVQKRFWETGGPDEAGFGDPEPFSAQAPARMAMVELAGRDGEVIETRKLEHSLARLTVNPLLRRSGRDFLLTVDYSAGFGSYSGPITHLLTVRDGHLRWAEVTDAATGKTEQISLMQSLKTVWRALPAGQGEVILEASCRPDFEHEGEFVLTYRRYTYDGTRWRYADRSAPGFSEFEDGFPRLSLFPR